LDRRKELNLYFLLHSGKASPVKGDFSPDGLSPPDSQLVIYGSLKNWGVENDFFRDLIDNFGDGA
jgi:hypothetical protein